MTLRNFLHGWLAAALTMSLICSLSISETHAGGAVALTPDEIAPVKVGDAAPSFTVTTAKDEPYVFDPENLERPVLLLSFRGGWCPYCNIYLSEMRHVIPDIKAMGVDVLFLSGDRPEILYSGLEQETQEDIAALDYTILSDADARAAIALGTAFAVSEKTMNKLKNGDYEITDSSVERHSILPVPSVFAIDRSGVVRFAFTNVNYRVRLPADDLIAAATEIAAAE